MTKPYSPRRLRLRGRVARARRRIEHGGADQRDQLRNYHGLPRGQVIVVRARRVDGPTATGAADWPTTDPGTVGPAQVPYSNHGTDTWAGCKEIRSPARAVPPCELRGEPRTGAVGPVLGSPLPLGPHPVAKSSLADSLWADSRGPVPPSDVPRPRDLLTAGECTSHAECGAAGCPLAAHSSTVCFRVET